MWRNKKLLFAFALLIVAAFGLAACQGAPAADAELVAQLEAELAAAQAAGESTAEELAAIQAELEAAQAEAEAGPEGPVAAEGLVSCQPLPELAFGTAGGARLARLSTGSTATSTLFSPVSRPVSQAGSVYKVGVFSDATSVNYWAANGPDNTVWNSYMLPPRLSLYGLSMQQFTFVPSVATDIPAPLTQEGDLWVVEIPIRDDMTWSDGTPVTANDMVFTAGTVLKFGFVAGNWGAWYDAGFLDHMEAVDDNTLKIFYHTKPGLARHQYGTLAAPFVAAHYWQPVADAAAAPIDALAADASEEQRTAAQQEATDALYAHVPDGEPLAGSFLFEKWEPGAFLENGAYADFADQGVTVREYASGAYSETPGSTYYGEAAGDVELEYTIGPYVDTVVYSVYGSQDAAILALQAGEVDYLLNPLGLQRGLTERIKADANLSVVDNNVNGFRYMGFNVRRQPMNDCAFRQAVAVLIDKEFVTGTVLQGVAFPLYSFVPEANAAWYFNDVPKLGQGLTREQRTNLAVAILEQAGFTWEGDKKPTWDADNRQVIPGGHLIMPDGKPVPPLTMPAPSAGYDPLRSTFAIWIEDWLNEFGIPLQANLAGFNVIVPIIFTEQNFDMWILGWSLGIFPDYLRDFFAEEGAVTDGNNAGGYINPEFEALADQLLSCESIETCRPIADQIQLILATEVPYVLLFDTGIIEAYRSAAVEFPFTEGLSGLQYFHQGGGGLQSQVNIR